MRLQVIDPAVHFACSSCARCCDQPWLTLIEPDKAAALAGVDWGTEWPALAGRALYHEIRCDGRTVLALAKGEGTRCIFLDSDNLCIIHKKLGAEAKPRVCRQFPHFAAIGRDADYVSANFGCRAVQEQLGPPLREQTDEIAACVPRCSQPADPEAPVLLAPGTLISQDAAGVLRERLGAIFAGAAGRSINERLATALALLGRTIATPREEVAESLRSGELAQPPALPDWTPFETAARAPLPSRFLLAATLFPDTLPPDATRDLGFVRRMTLIPRLMALTKMRGAYASRLLGRSVQTDQILDRPADTPLAPEATALLGRYLRSRIWQQFPAGSQLPVFSGLHQHVLDINAVVFYARAIALEQGRPTLDYATVAHALTLVEFHLATQRRLYSQVLKKWLRAALADPAVAWCSLRMLRTAGTPMDAAVTNAHAAAMPGRR